MKKRKTIYLTQQAIDTLNNITKTEYRTSNSNTIEHIIKQYKPTKV